MVITLLLLQLHNSSSAQSLNNMYVTDGTVNTIAVDGDNAFIGGDFNVVGPITGYMAKLSVQSYVPDMNFPIVNGYVNTIVPDGNGGWYVGGWFTKVGNTDKKNLFQISADGVVNQNWNPKPNGEVLSIAVGEYGVYVGGHFDSIGGKYRNAIAQVNTTTGAASKSWLPSLSSSTPTSIFVNCINVIKSDVYFGGLFDSVAGKLLVNLAKVDAITGIPSTNWTPNPNGTVNTILIENDKLYVGGAFTYVSNTSMPYIAKIDTVLGKIDSHWNSLINGEVITASILDSNVYIGGSFKSVAGMPRMGIARLNKNTGVLDNSWTTQTNGEVYSVVTKGTSVYAAGSFTMVNNRDHNRIARIYTSTGGTELVWNPNANGDIFTIAMQGNDVVVGGNLTSIGGRARKNVARLNLKTGIVDENWNPGTDGVVRAIEVLGNNVFLGGKFSMVGGQPRRSVAKVNKHITKVELSFDAQIGGGDIPNVYALAVDSSSVFIGGDFVAIEGLSCYRLAKLDANTGKRDILWEPNLQPTTPGSSFVRTLKLKDGHLYVGGFFSSIKGSPCNGFAKINRNTADVDQNLIYNFNGTVQTIAFQNQNVYVGGTFTQVGKQDAAYTLKFDDTFGSIDTVWKPNPNFVVNSILVMENDLYLGGGFSEIGGRKQNMIARVNNTTGEVDKTWLPGSIEGIMIRELEAYSSEILAGGYFSAVDNQPKSNLAAFSRTPVDIDLEENTDNILLPNSISLSQNYPNPFNPETTIEFSLPVSGIVKVTVYSALGESIVELVNAYHSSGLHRVNWKADTFFGSGVYFYTIYLLGEDGAEYKEVKKMLLLK